MLESKIAVWNLRYLGSVIRKLRNGSETNFCWEIQYLHFLSQQLDFNAKQHLPPGAPRYRQLSTSGPCTRNYKKLKLN